jgi:Putative zinc-finger
MRAICSYMGEFAHGQLDPPDAERVRDHLVDCGRCYRGASCWQLGAFVRHQLDPRDAERVRDHLADCGPCYRRLDALEVGLEARRRQGEEMIGICLQLGAFVCHLLDAERVGQCGHCQAELVALNRAGAPHRRPGRREPGNRVR